MIYSFKINALGTVWWLNIEGESKHHTNWLFKSVKKMIIEFESKYSRFDSQSYIGILNSTKELSIDDEELYDILRYGLELDRITDGIFSPFVGSDLENLGYGISLKYQERLPPAFVIEFSNSKIMISEGASFDIGGYGKGWLVDKISNYLEDNNCIRYSINAGGDIRCDGFEDSPQVFYLENPSLDGTYIGEIRIASHSLASSSTNRRRWTDTKGGISSHIIDTRSHSSICNSVSATYTTANSCLDADVSATLLLINPQLDVWSIVHDTSIEYLIVNKDGSYYATSKYQGVLYT